MLFTCLHFNNFYFEDYIMTLDDDPSTNTNTNHNIIGVRRPYDQTLLTRRYSSLTIHDQIDLLSTRFLIVYSLSSMSWKCFPS